MSKCLEGCRSFCPPSGPTETADIGILADKNVVASYGAFRIPYRYTGAGDAKDTFDKCFPDKPPTQEELLVWQLLDLIGCQPQQQASGKSLTVYSTTVQKCLQCLTPVMYKGTKVQKAPWQTCSSAKLKSEQDKANLWITVGLIPRAAMALIYPGCRQHRWTTLERNPLYTQRTVPFSDLLHTTTGRKALMVPLPNQVTGWSNLVARMVELMIENP